MSASTSSPTTASALGLPAGGGVIAQLLATGGTRSVFQPIVRLSDHAVVAYEALGRGPAGSPLESPKGGLLAHSIAIERRAHASLDPLVVFGCFQSARHFTPDTGRRYARLADRAAFVGAFGVGLGPEPVSGVRGAALAVNEGLAGEWNVLVAGPHDTAGLIARDLGDTGPDHERRFAYALVEDRDVVLAAARSLMLRVMAG